ncbi:MAG: histidine phosphatase family protein [Xanthomonadales bacterium]|nr:histidine phosphatase family protein [Xanthomonadales bacterium]
MKLKFWLFIFALLLVTTAHGKQNILLLRHAEKMTELKDPPLTANGHKRAECMAEWLAAQPFAEEIKHIYSSNYRRTLETATPLALRLGVSIRLYDTRKLGDLAVKINANKNSVVIVGHSNTTPALAGHFSGQKIKPMEETDYNSYWRVNSAGAVKLDQRLIACEF